MKYLATQGDHKFNVDVDDQETGPRVDVDGVSMQMDLTPVDGDGTYSLIIDGQSYTAVVLETSETCRVMIDGQAFSFEVEDEALARLRSQVKRKQKSGPQEIKAPMPGRVVAIEVAVGETVEAGQGIVIIEAMKMENELKSHAPGTIKQVSVAVGDAVNKGDVLVVMENTVGLSD